MNGMIFLREDCLMMSDKLYFNGDILTMEEELYTKAVLVRDHKIYKLGPKEELMDLAHDQAEYIDLQGNTLMPSFIDCHSHFTGYANSFLQVSLENAENFNDIILYIQNFIEKNRIAEGQWVIAHSYDHNHLEERTHPTKDILDQAAPKNPVVIQHQSGHSGVFNSMGLKELNITNETISPEGGIIYIKEGELTGYLEENAFVNYIQEVPMPSMEDLIKSIEKAQEKYASYGITTMQEGMVVNLLTDLLNYVRKSNVLKLDYIAYVDIKDAKNILEKFKGCMKEYDNHFKIGGYKVFLDGSPQSKTAYMLEPYLGDEKYCGYPIYKDEELEDKIKESIKDNMQLIAHCNGDAATKQYITVYEKALKHCPTKNQIRPVIIHAQLLPEDQLEDVKRLHMIPSFFVAHVYYWGDTHIRNFGIERASKISIAGSTARKKIPFTLHQDSPVIEPNMLETIWIAVNRITKEGILLGEEERITPLEALKAVTIYGAYQYFEEDRKGSMKENKLADLIILDKNPLKVDPMHIKDIKVLETIKEGETIYKRV